jgi:hypothetical protein
MQETGNVPNALKFAFRQSERRLHMAGGYFFVNFKTEHPTLYLIGILVCLALGVVAAILGFAGVVGGPGLGVAGVIVAIVGVVFLIEFLGTK